MNEMYKRIEDLCSRNGMNITEMCREAGVARSNLTDLKMGRTNTLSSKTLVSIANYFDVPLEYLLHGDTQSISADNNSVVLSNTVGNNNVNTPVAQNPEMQLSEDEEELLRIYRKLNFRQKHEIISRIYQYADRNKRDRYNPLDVSIQRAAAKRRSQELAIQGPVKDHLDESER